MAEPERLILPDPEATGLHGRCLAAALLELRPERLIVHLEGDLGSGKTTWARGFLEGLGHAGRVPSPTYTLVEPYSAAGYDVYHVDLYRMRAPDEVDYLGLLEQLGQGSIALVEWPELGTGHLPRPDIRLRFDLHGTARRVRVEGLNADGARLLDKLQQFYRLSP